MTQRSMMLRLALRRAAGSCIVTLCAAALLAGCASRSLSPLPPVIDRSSEGRPVRVVPETPVLYTVKRDDTLFSLAKRFNATTADLIAWNGLPPDGRLRVDQVLRVSPPTPGPPAADNSPVAVTRPIGSETVDQRPLGSSPEAAPSSPPAAAPGGSTAPLVTGPMGLKRPYSDATLAELAKPDPGSASPAPPVTPDATPRPSVPDSAPRIVWAWPASGKVVEPFVEGRTKGIALSGKAGDAVLAAADGKVSFSGAGVRGYGNFVIVRHSPELLSVYANNKTNLVKEGATVTRGQKIAEMGDSDSDAVKLHFEIRNDSKPVDPLKYLPER